MERFAGRGALPAAPGFIETILTGTAAAACFATGFVAGALPTAGFAGGGLCGAALAGAGFAFAAAFFAGAGFFLAGLACPLAFFFDDAIRFSSLGQEPVGVFELRGQVSVHHGTPAIERSRGGTHSTTVTTDDGLSR
ncbi:MAG TPA: hypothetical protein VFM88_17060 [Vicinamibacteria bacterium]|nr:hypothetical protein [Vicinamibacteria bacterium]